MCPSSWTLYLDDFPFLGSSLARLEPKLELFEVWEINMRQIIIIANGINSQTIEKTGLSYFCVLGLNETGPPVYVCSIFGENSFFQPQHAKTNF